METHTSHDDSTKEHTKKRYINIKFKKPKPIVVMIGTALILMVAAHIITRSFFVAALVNGSPISRWSIIKELEKESGKQALESAISQKLVEDELKKQKITVEQKEIDAEIATIEKQLATQGGTLDQALAAQNMTKEKLVEQITMQKKIEKLLADKVAVTDAEIDAYIKDAKLTTPKGTSTQDFRKELGEYLKKEKLQQEIQSWISELTGNAKIKYLGNYK